MSASFTVFVCSTFDDLEQEREAVLDAIKPRPEADTMRWSSSAPVQAARSTSAWRRFAKAISSSSSSDSSTAACLPGWESRIRKPNTRRACGSKNLASSICATTTFPSWRKYVERDPDKLRLLEAWKQTLNGRHTVAKFENWPRLAVQVAADIGNFLLVRAAAEAKGVAEAPLREVLKRLGETEVAEAEIPDRLTKAADELLRLRADLARLSNDRPEFAAIRARASGLIDKGDFDAARAVLNEGREGVRALREEASRTEAGFLADEARVDRLQLNYDSACAKFAEAARLDPDNIWLWGELGDLWITRGSLTEAGNGFLRGPRRRRPQRE